MINITDIKAQYATMTDGELAHLLPQADGLRRDAFLALKQECRKRNILFDLVKETDDSLVDEKKERIRENISKEEKKWWSAVLAYAYEQKLNDASDDSILAGILGMQASLEEALFVENNLEKFANKELDDAITDRMAGITKAVCGIAIMVIVHLALLRNSIMIYGGIIMVVGLVQIANAESRKSRYKTIIQNILSQRAGSEKDEGDGFGGSLLMQSDL